MIGYMKPIKKSLDANQRRKYMSFYCGLCRCLKYEYGLTGTAFLNYETVNMLLLIESVSEKEFPSDIMSCTLTPFIWKNMCLMENEYFCRAAAMTVLIADLEAEDNFIDENRLKDRIIYKVTSSKAKKAEKIYDMQVKKIKESYERYMKLEKRAKEDLKSVSFDEITKACGEIVGLIAEFIADGRETDCVSKLKAMMCYWGEWVYIVDALDDYSEDIRCGKFNPLLLWNKSEPIAERLTETEKKSNDILDNLKLKRNRVLIDLLFKEHFPSRRKTICEKAIMA